MTVYEDIKLLLRYLNFMYLYFEWLNEICFIYAILKYVDVYDICERFICVKFKYERLCYICDLHILP